MTTQAAREHFIQQALSDFNSEDPAARETLKVAFHGGMILPVIEVPIDLPVLNAKSFRIAPQLADHPDADGVEADPDSDSSQAIVAQLVREAHRKIEDLKGSLIAGQHQPGVITRTGKLINANTRCVLLRELWAEGKVTSDRIRVAVLPATFSASDELQLESVLQQQREHKDEYNFISELLMLRTLHEKAGLSHAAIAAQQERGVDGVRKVKTLLSILDLMETARRLLDPANPVPISRFVTEKSQEENWTGILRKYNQLRKNVSQAAADELLRGFLVSNYLNLGAVHKGGRAIDENWVSEDLVKALKANDDEIAQTLVTHVEQLAAEPTEEKPAPDGVDLLGDPDETPASPVGNAVLSIVTQAATQRTGDLKLVDGTSVDAADALAVLTQSAEEAIANVNRGNPAERPGKLLETALKNLQQARDVLTDVAGGEDFAELRDDTYLVADQAQIVLTEVLGLLQDTDSD